MQPWEWLVFIAGVLFLWVPFLIVMAGFYWMLVSTAFNITRTFWRYLRRRKD